MAKKGKAHKKRLVSLTDRLKKKTKGIEVEHRESWGDELRCNQSTRSLAEATAMKRSWLVVISIYWEGPYQDYVDEYKYEFQSCTLTDEKSILKFDTLRDHILSVEKAKGNAKHYLDWGWFATPWESRFKRIESMDEVLIASFKKE